MFLKEEAHGINKIQDKGSEYVRFCLEVQIDRPDTDISAARQFPYRRALIRSFS